MSGVYEGLTVVELAREIGKVVVRGPNIVPGHGNKPEATAAVLRPRVLL